MSKASLKLDWCSHAAAKYACEHWHYSACMPSGKLIKIGAWEQEKFIGVVIFGRGATPNLCKPYGLTQLQCCELVRVALTQHAAPVTRIVSIAVKMASQLMPGMRLVVSFADPLEGHHGGIYQGGNWVYCGESAKSVYFRVHGRVIHPRSIGALGGKQSIGWIRAHMDPNAAEVYKPGKHRYLMPLDDDMRRQIEPLRKPYPKRAGSAESGTLCDQHGGGGATPTPALTYA